MGVRLRWLAAVVACLALAGSVLALRPTEHDRTVTVQLADSAGLFVGNDVGVLGIPIGSVTGIEPHGEVVDVTLTLTDDDVRVPADVDAAVVARSVAADRYIELTPVYTDGPVLADGDTIPEERTSTPVDFDEVLASLTKLGDDLADDPGSLNHLDDLLDAASSTLAGHGQDFHDATTSMARAVGEVSGQRDDLISSLTSLADLTSLVADHEEQVRRVVHDLSGASDLLADERGTLGEALTALHGAVHRLGVLAERHGPALRRELAQLTRVLGNTLDSKQDIREILEVLPLAAQNLQRAISSEGRIRVQQDPTSLTPLGPQVDELCTQLDGLCGLISVPPSLGQILSLLGAGSGVTP